MSYSEQKRTVKLEQQYSAVLEEKTSPKEENLAVTKLLAAGQSMHPCNYLAIA